MLSEEGNKQNTGTKSRALRRVLMGENPILQNTIGRGNEWGGGTGTMAALTACKKQGTGGGDTGLSALTEAVKCFGPAAITQEFSKKLLKRQVDVGGESKKRATFKIQAAEAENWRVFVGMVKGDAELKIFHSMLKYNNLFVAQNLSGNVIAFRGDHPLEVRP